VLVRVAVSSELESSALLALVPSDEKKEHGEEQSCARQTAKDGAHDFGGVEGGRVTGLRVCDGGGVGRFRGCGRRTLRVETASSCPTT
jgi:hypothetical protein